jgi:hypothetical protein
MVAIPATLPEYNGREELVYVILHAKWLEKWSGWMTLRWGNDF